MKAYLSAHTVNIWATLRTSILQKRSGNLIPHIHAVALQDSEDNYDDFMDMTVNIKKMRGDIVNFSQTLNYALLHATKPSSEAHTIIKRAMRQSNGFESWRQGRPPSSTIFTSSHNDDSRSQAGIATLNTSPSSTTSGTINDHVKIATVVNNLKGSIAQNLLMRINQATIFDEAHQWISNYFNSTYTGTNEYNKGQVGGVNNYDDENYDNE
eukprot:992363-Amphidinium_carterae.2